MWKASLTPEAKFWLLIAALVILSTAFLYFAVM